MSDLIARYAAAVRYELSFDRRCAQRLAIEAEDHLYEALERDAAGPSDAAARRAIGRFGSPTDIAAVYTAEIFPERLKATWRSSILLGALVMLTMWLRRALDLLPQIDSLSGTKVLLATDAAGFRIAITIGVVAWLLSVIKPAIQRASLIVKILMAAAVALGFSVAANVIVASVAVVKTEASPASFIALGSAILASVLMAFLLIKLRMLQGYASLIMRSGR